MSRHQEHRPFVTQSRTAFVPLRTAWLLLAILAITTIAPVLRAQSDAPTANYKTVADIEFARVGEEKLLLNLYLPTNATKPPLVVFMHGGGWRTGDHKDKFPLFLAQNGYAVASIDYRENGVRLQRLDKNGFIRCWEGMAGGIGI